MQNLHKTLLWQFSLLKHITDVACDDRLITAKQTTHLVLGQPNGLAVGLDFHLHLLVRFVNNNLLVHRDSLSILHRDHPFSSAARSASTESVLPGWSWEKLPVMHHSLIFADFENGLVVVPPCRQAFTNS